MAGWIYCVVAVTLLLTTIAFETETVPATGPRIALMLIPAAVVLVTGAHASGLSPAPLTAGTFALAWTVLSGLHPGRVWRPEGSVGRRRAFGALWAAIALGIAVWVATTP